MSTHRHFRVCAISIVIAPLLHPIYTHIHTYIHMYIHISTVALCQLTDISEFVLFRSLLHRCCSLCPDTFSLQTIFSWTPDMYVYMYICMHEAAYVQTPFPFKPYFLEHLICMYIYIYIYIGIYMHVCIHDLYRYMYASI